MLELSCTHEEACLLDFTNPEPKVFFLVICRPILCNAKGPSVARCRWKPLDYIELEGEAHEHSQNHRIDMSCNLDSYMLFMHAFAYVSSTLAWYVHASNSYFV